MTSKPVRLPVLVRGVFIRGDVAGTWGCVSGVAASAYYWVLEDQPICPSFGGWVD